MKYKFLQHTADIKFQAFGDSTEKCFENAGYALLNIMCRQKIKSALKKRIIVRGNDFESLLYNFLEEFLFLLDSENFLLGEIKEIKINKKKNKYELIAEICGDKTSDYEMSANVKAITYHEMFVRQEKEKWVCQVVVDV